MDGKQRQASRAIAAPTLDNAGPNKDQRREQLISAAWENWRERDYSWGGLEKQKADGFSSLRDYWIKTASPEGKLSDTHIHGEIVKQKGQKDFHIAHLPVTYDDGTPTIKATSPDHATDLFLSAFYTRLNRPTMRDANGKTIPHYFEGIVFPKIPREKLKYHRAISADFRRAIFYGNPHFFNVMFNGDATFFHATFVAAASFTKVRFIQTPTFEHTVFCATSSFADTQFESEVRFDSSTFIEDASFQGATFSQPAFFFDAEFLSRADFKSCKFVDQAYFGQTSFGAMARFEDSTFEHHANFWNSTFNGSMNFQKAKFLRHANFCDHRSEMAQRNHPEVLVLPTDPTNYCRAFDKAIFTEIADFSYWGFKAFSAFSGATFNAGLKLDFESPDRAKQNFASELALLGNGARPTVFLRVLAAFRLVQSPTPNVDRDHRLRALEAGCRMLKQEMAEESDKVREYLLYKFELMARRAQDSTSLIECFTSQIYEIVSDYGTSISRPIQMLVCTWLFFGMLYLGLFHPESNFFNNVLSAFSVSASRIFPFGAFGRLTEFYANDINQFNNPLGAHIFMYLATIESVCAAILLFLTALGVRRRFQIS